MHLVAWPKPQFNGATKILFGCILQNCGEEFKAIITQSFMLKISFFALGNILQSKTIFIAVYFLNFTKIL